MIVQQSATLLREQYNIKDGITDCLVCPLFCEKADQHCHAKFVKIFKQQCNLIKITEKK